MLAAKRTANEPINASVGQNCWSGRPHRQLDNDLELGYARPGSRGGLVICYRHVGRLCGASGGGGGGVRATLTWPVAQIGRSNLRMAFGFGETRSRN